MTKTGVDCMAGAIAFAPVLLYSDNDAEWRVGPTALGVADTRTPGQEKRPMAKKKKNPVQNLLDMAGDFVTEQKGKWEHKDWEAFLGQVQKAGVTLTDEVKRNLGNILEASKHFYNSISTVPNKKPARKPRPKAKSKAKSKG
ncbi:MAG: hypothetical protein AMXMBFR4_14480 [Candidatus Hydrogenedentota bacterium]